MREAVNRFVTDGMSIVTGCALESLIPFAAAHEILRQHKKNLTLIGPISDILFDQMIGAGAVRQVIAAWVGNVSTGIGYNFRRAVEQSIPHSLIVENHSNLSIAVGLQAGAMGVPFGVTYSLLGSDIRENTERFRRMECPFTGEKLLAVKAINPDLAVIHAQQADERGNIRGWGNFGVMIDAAKASKYVIAVVEEIVPTGVIRSDPNRTIIPGFRVNAVVHEPWGAHPSGVQGYYNHHDDFYVEYARRTRNLEDSRAWTDRYIYGVRSRSEYMETFFREDKDSLRVRHHAPSPSVEFGY